MIIDSSWVLALEKLADSARSIPRFSSSGEISLLKNLLAKHGRDFEAMAKDRRLNSWQVCKSGLLSILI